MPTPLMTLNDTWEFTLVSSVSPDAAPVFAIFTASGTIIASFTSVQSDANNYSALFTAEAVGPYVAQWKALKTLSSSIRQFVSAYPFRVTSQQVAG